MAWPVTGIVMQDGAFVLICIILVLLAVLLCLRYLASVRKAQSPPEWQAISDAIEAPLLICSDMQVLGVNRAFHVWALENGVSDIGLLPEQTLLSTFIPDTEAVHQLITGQETLEDASIETELLLGEERIPVAIHARPVSLHDTLLHILTLHDHRQQTIWEEKLFLLESHDPVTHLPNHAFFENQVRMVVERAARMKKTCTLLRIFLDQNEDLLLGTERVFREDILQALAKRLEMDIPAHALVAHVDTAEFAVFFPDVPDGAEARLLGQHLKRLINRPLMMGERKIDISASIGSASFPDDAADASELLRNASLALTKARAEGGGRFRPYQGQMGQEFERRTRLAKDLANAIVNGEVHPWFQPVMQARTRHLSAFEALVRWTHPQFGTISPGEFLVLAEENHLMGVLTEAVFRSSLTVAAHWPSHIRLCVNISPTQLTSSMIDTIATLLQESRFDPERLEIEVTEDVLIHDFQHAASMFSRLRAMGVQVAMDDFGAGFTSLGNLRYLHFDRIKIDRIFTMNLPGHRRVEAAVRAMMVLARELDITVTVEGVETEEQLAFLQREGCDEVQGFLFSQARPPQELERFFTQAAPSGLLPLTGKRAPLPLRQSA
jgi:diguanylate cyclase